MNKFCTYYLLAVMSGGVFLTSRHFINIENDIKFYTILLFSILLLLICSLRPRGLEHLHSSIRSTPFYWGLSLLSLILAIQGLAQYIGLLDSLHTHCPITGSFENTAGYIAVQSLLLPFSLYLFFNGKYQKGLKVILLVSAALTGLSIILSESRCGVLAMLAVILAMTIVEKKIPLKFRHYKLIWALGIFTLILLIYILYHLKKDSADGRLFIWTVCLELIKDKPIIGHGIHGFQSLYMDYQANYFISHPQSKYVMLADNIIHPFSEWLKITVNFGIVGLSVVGMSICAICRKLIKAEGMPISIGLSIISSLLVLCSFSYPFHYAAVCFLALFPLLYTIPLSSIKAFCKFRYTRFIFSLILCIVICFVSRMAFLDLKWAEVCKRSLAGKTEQMLPNYASMMPEMKYNPLFLYNYSAELNFSGHYEESQQIINECLKRYNDYDIQILIANNYENMSQWEVALDTYQNALNMIPCRFIPLEAMMRIYRQTGDTIKADSIAQIILHKPVKVPSAEIDAMKEEAKRVKNEE